MLISKPSYNGYINSFTLHIHFIIKSYYETLMYMMLFCLYQQMWFPHLIIIILKACFKCLCFYGNYLHELVPVTTEIALPSLYVTLGHNIVQVSSLLWSSSLHIRQFSIIYHMYNKILSSNPDIGQFSLIPPLFQPVFDEHLTV